MERTMKIENLGLYAIPDKWIQLLKEKYPEGRVDLIDVIKNEEIALELLHYLRKYVELRPDEMEAYWSRCKVSGAINVWSSDNVENATTVWNSTHVLDSSFIYNSADVTNSYYVFGSEDINEASNIKESKFVKNSNKIVSSSDISDSSQIARSRVVEWSECIVNSDHVNESKFCYMSSDILNSRFCGFCHDASDCLFSIGLTGAKYQIFNKPVDIATFEEWKEKIDYELMGENLTFIKINNDEVYAETRFEVSNRFDAIFDGLSPDFYGFVSTLPNYSDEGFLNLFFRNRKLEK